MPGRNRRLTALAPAAVAMLLLALQPAQAADAREQVLKDDWMALYIQGQKAGYAHAQTVKRETETGPVYVSTIYEKVSLARGSTQVTIAVTDVVTEDKAGRLVAFSHEVDQGLAKMLTRGEVQGDRMILTTTAAGITQSQAAQAPRGLCPWAVERVSHARGYAPGTTYSLPVFTTQAPTQDAVLTVRIGQKEPVQVFEVAKWLYPAEGELSILPGIKTTEWLDDAGQVWLARTKMALLDIELRKVSKSVALQPSDPVEVMMAAAILPDRPIPDPRNCRALTLLISSADPVRAGFELPSDEFQAVRRREGGLEVAIRRAEVDPGRTYKLPYRGREYADLLKSTPWLEVEDAQIVQMSKEAVGGEPNALTAAWRIEAYVARQIEHKKLGMGFATAAETARQKAGDCTEHAVLAAALSRAAGMPSRVVCGLACGGPASGDTQQKFYFHMWTEVFVGEWFPLDAALGAHDATHIAIARSGLDNPGDLVDVTAGILPIIGATRIQVLRLGG